MRIGILITFILLLAFQEVHAWGFWAHKRINRIAVFTLPPEMFSFYKENIEFITDNAVNPDKRRYATEGEAPRHYIDIDHYGKYPFKDFPRRWDDAVAKYSEDTLQAYGIVPWHIQVMLFRLTEAFKQKNKYRILSLSADLGHYVGDAHVPLHTTKNYNGQYTNQKGIHGFWESRIPELSGENYDYFVGKARYVEKPLQDTWKYILESHSHLDSVFGIESRLTKNFPSDQKYSFEQRGEQIVKVYSKEFSLAYERAMDGMVEKRMRESILKVGDLWFTCWVDAGQPDLDRLLNRPFTEEELKQMEQDKEASKKKSEKHLGREHGEH